MKCVQLADTAALATDERVNRRARGGPPTRGQDDVPLRDGKSTSTDQSSRSRVQARPLYSHWCRTGQHWACYGRCGQGGRNTCECGCHQTAKTHEGIEGFDEHGQRLYELSLSSADLQMIQVCTRWICDLGLAPDVRARLVHLEQLVAGVRLAG
jgi:hypothetical protein